MSRRDKSSLEMEKRSIPLIFLIFFSFQCLFLLKGLLQELTLSFIDSLRTSPQWKTRCVVLQKPSPVAGMRQTTFNVFIYTVQRLHLCPSAYPICFYAVKLITTCQLASWLCATGAHNAPYPCQPVGMSCTNKPAGLKLAFI